MNCTTFMARLDGWLAGDLSTAEMRDCREHLRACPTCAGMVAMLRGEAPAPALPDAEALTRGVLQHTTGPACAAAEALLGDALDVPQGDAAARIAVHLAHCTPCRQLAAALRAARADLATLVEETPDPGFATDVLRRLEPLRRRRLPWRRRLRELGERWMQRPRFAWEVAYVFSVVTALLFGTPFSPYRTVPRQALAAIEVAPRDALERGGALVNRALDATRSGARAAWSGSFGRAQASAGERWNAFVDARPDARAAWTAMDTDIDTLNAAVRSRNLAAAALALEALGNDAAAFWQGLRDAPSPPDSLAPRRSAP